MQTHLEQVRSLLSSTGQTHMEEFPYDHIRECSIITSEGELVIGAIGVKGTRVVDIAVHPSFRKQGIASFLIKQERVYTAYVVSEDAYQFWIHIGWFYYHNAVDKGTKVRVMVKERGVKISE